MKIQLTKSECDYIRKANFFPLELLELFLNIEKQEVIYILKLLQTQADEIRDLCGERLQFVGFDEKYELTKEGKILESLIDKLFLG